MERALLPAAFDFDLDSDTRPLKTATHLSVSQKNNGVSALGLQRVLGPKSYETAWTWLHKLRRAMVRPGRDLLTARVEVDECYPGSGLKGGPARAAQPEESADCVAAQEDGPGIVPDNQVKTLRDLPNDGGNYYLSYYEGKHRQMPSVGRFADDAKQKLVQKRKELDARASGVELPPEPQPKPESDITVEVNKFLGQQAAFVGNDGYGAARKSITAYKNRLDFYLRFCAEHHVTDFRLADYDHLMEYVGWLRKQTNRNGKPISDRYVFLSPWGRREILVGRTSCGRFKTWPRRLSNRHTGRSPPPPFTRNDNPFRRGPFRHSFISL